MRAAVRPLSFRMAEQVAEVLAAGMVGWWTQLSWTCCNRNGPGRGQGGERGSDRRRLLRANKRDQVSLDSSQWSAARQGRED
jgi:hypothetical protein